MTLDDSIAEAERLLSQAGWRPIVASAMRGRYVAPELGLVGGRPPTGADAAVKSWTAIAPGHDLYSADTPDEPHEAAAWLVARFVSPLAPPDAGVAAPTVQEPLDLSAEMLGDVESDRSGASIVAAEGDVCDLQQESAPSTAYIFGDNLDQKRTAAIGLVWLHADTLIPAWTEQHQAELVAGRNYVMGVQVNGWPDDPAQRAALDNLEATAARIREIEAARDGKIAFLRTAVHADLERFDPAARWP